MPPIVDPEVQRIPTQAQPEVEGSQTALYLNQKYITVTIDSYFVKKKALCILCRF